MIVFRLESKMKSLDDNYLSMFLEILEAVTTVVQDEKFLREKALERQMEALRNVESPERTLRRLSVETHLNGINVRRTRINGVEHPSTQGVKAARAKYLKRTPEQLRVLEQKFMNVVKHEPGSNIEHLAKQLGVESRELQLPVKKLFAAKKLRKKGAKRATKYFAR